MRDINGQVAWVTGAGTGIGEAAAERLAGAGCAVILTGRRKEPLDAVAARIAAAGGTAVVEPGDASDRPTMMAIGARAVERFGAVDILFNNHGTNHTPRTWGDGQWDDWDYIVDVNLKGAYSCIAAVLPAMRAKGAGLVITTSSKAGRFYSPIAGVAYGMSKHGVMAMNALLNDEEGKNGIRGCVICPGEVATPILDRRPVEVPMAERQMLVQPEDVADLVLFVATMHPRARLDEIVISPSRPRPARARG